MKSLLTKLTLVFALLTPITIYSQTNLKPVPTATQTTPSGPVKLDELDELKLENSFLRANAAQKNAKQASDTFEDEAKKVREIISTLEKKYNATFDVKTGVFIPNAKK